MGMGMGMDMDDMEMDDDFMKYVYIILVVVGVFFILVGILICCKIRSRSTKPRIVYGRSTTDHGIITTQSVYDQYGGPGRQVPVPHGTPTMNTQSPLNVTGFSNPHYGNHSPQTHPHPVRNEFFQIPQQSQSQAVSAPYYYNKGNESVPQHASGPPYVTNVACSAPPSYEEIHNEAHQKQLAYNPNYTNDSSRY